MNVFPLFLLNIGNCIFSSRRKLLYYLNTATLNTSSFLNSYLIEIMYLALLSELSVYNHNIFMVRY